ncbi:ATP-binding protein [Nocardia sp. NPDC004068]|uniref:ATP-binding protein n=1 Tax=Nocardia sp. NPDC004068 TaxID=3364303 RepID=UPI00367CE7C8
MDSTDSQGGPNEASSARAFFAARFADLYREAGNPPLQRVADRANERVRLARGRGSGYEVKLQRISDWRAGRNVPARFENVEPVVLTLIDLARSRSSSIPAELIKLQTWRRYWKAAHKEVTAPDPAMHSEQKTALTFVSAVLRRDIDAFVGREEELRFLRAALTSGRGGRTYTIDGMAGSGKTALVTRLGHLVADHYPDGRYFIELNAHTPGVPDVKPFDALGALLGDLGIAPRHLPATMTGRRDLWQGRVADRRVLLILDDARDSDQIEPLIPAGHGCSTLVTSRRRMIGLDAAVPVTLGNLEADEAAELFYATARRGREEPEAATVSEIVDLCGRLPLAIVLLAAHLAHHPSWTVSDLASRFVACDDDRLSQLRAGARAVRTAFTTSYLALPEQRRHVLRSLGLHAGPDLDAWTAATLADLPITTIGDELEALYIDHLVEEIAPGRYRLHDLLREYSRELGRDDSPHARLHAVLRTMDYYHTTGAEADRHLSPPPRPHAREPATPQSGARSRIPRFDTSTQALQWLRAERANISSYIELAESVAPERVGPLIEVLAGLLERDGPWSKAANLHQRAREAAQQADDRAGEATASTNLGRLRHLSGEFAEATELFRAAAVTYRDIGDLTGEATALTNIGMTCWRTGDYPQALAALRAALPRYQEIGERRGEAVAHLNLAAISYVNGHRVDAVGALRQTLRIYRELGTRSESITGLENLDLATRLMGYDTETPDFYSQALALYQEIGNRVGEATVLTNLGVVRRRTGHHTEAADLLERALAIHRESGGRAGQAIALLNLGLLARILGDPRAAATRFNDALSAYRELGDRRGETETLNEIGELLIDTGEIDRARTSFTAALELARSTGDPSQHGRALAGIDRCGTPLNHDRPD